MAHIIEHLLECHGDMLVVMQYRRIGETKIVKTTEEKAEILISCGGKNNCLGVWKQKLNHKSI